MNDIRTYQLEVQGQVDEYELNATGPVKMNVMCVDGTTRLTVHADQSCLIGLIRHLHGRGVVLLSVHVEQ